MARRGRALWVVAALSLAQCGKAIPRTPCDSDLECHRGAIQGRCVRAPSRTSWCAFPTRADECPSRLAWGLLAGEDLAGTCVAGEVGGEDADGGTSGMASGGAASAGDAAGGAAEDGVAGAPCEADGLSCYTGPPQTLGIGVCRPGLQRCALAGLVCDGEVLPVFEDTSTPEDENCDTRLGRQLWSRSYGDSAPQVGGDLAIDQAGNLYAAGYYEGTFDLGPKPSLTQTGAANAWVAKFDPAGKALWSRGFGDADVQSGKGVAVDRSGNVILAGPFQGSIDFGKGALVASERDFYVAKLDRDGNTLWAKSFGGVGFQDAQALVVDLDDNIVISGVFDGQLSFGGGVPLEPDLGGDRDAFVAKLDADGNHIWSKSSGGKGVQLLLGLNVDAQGNILATGTFENEFPLGNLKLDSTTQPQALALKLDAATGQALWSKHLGASWHYLATKAIASDVAGATYVTTAFAGGWPEAGAFQGETDLLVVKLDAVGGLVWAKLWGGAGREWGDALSVDSTGDVTVAAGFYDQLDVGQGRYTSRGQQDIALLKLDTLGNVLWMSQFGNAAQQRAAAVKVDSSGALAMLATSTGDVTFGDALLAGFGSNDIVLAKLQR
jgi:hypothetical protein